MNDSPARTRMLQRIRKALDQDREYSTAAFQELLRQAPVAHASLAVIDAPDKTFVQQATAAGARVLEMSAASEVPEWLQASEMAALPVSISTQADIRALDWSGLQLTDDYRNQGKVGVVKAAAAAAETGTLLLHSRDVPSGQLYLVEILVVLLDRRSILPRYEDLWAQGPQRSEAGTPRAIHLITGPSRTADVEQTIQVGAHGPREMHLAVLG